MKHALKTRGDETVEATRVIRLTEETSELREQSGGLSQAQSHVDGTQAIEGGIEPSLRGHKAFWGGTQAIWEAEKPTHRGAKPSGGTLGHHRSWEQNTVKHETCRGKNTSRCWQMSLGTVVVCGAKGM
jgi:hypothetical protein